MKKILNIYSLPKLLLIALGCALFVIFPEVTWIPWELSKLGETEKFGYLAFFMMLIMCPMIVCSDDNTQTQQVPEDE